MPGVYKRGTEYLKNLSLDKSGKMAYIKIRIIYREAGSLTLPFSLF